MKQLLMGVAASFFGWILTSSAQAQYPAEDLRVWVINDLAEGEDGDEDDDVCMGVLLMLADYYTIEGITVASRPDIVTGWNTDTWTENTFIADYKSEVGLLNAYYNNRYQPDVDVYMASTAGTTFDEIRGQTLNANYLNANPQMQALIDAADAGPLYLLNWGPMTETAMLIKYCLENNKTDTLSNITMISHWTQRGGPWNCGKDNDACNYVHDQAEAGNIVMIELGPSGQDGLVENSCGSSVELDQAITTQSAIGKHLEAKWVLNRNASNYVGMPDMSDGATILALLGFGGGLDTYYSDDGLAPVNQNAANNALCGDRRGIFNLLEERALVAAGELSRNTVRAGIVNIDITSNANAGPSGGNLAGVVGNANGANRWNAVGDDSFYTSLVDKDGARTGLTFQLTGAMAATQNDVDNLGEFFINALSDNQANGEFFESYAWVTGVDSQQDRSSFTVGGFSSGATADLYLYATWPWADTGSQFRLSSDGGSTWTTWRHVDGTPSEADAPLSEGSSYALFEDVAVHSDGTIRGEWRSILGAAGAHRGMFNGLQVESSSVPYGGTPGGGAPEGVYIESEGLVIMEAENTPSNLGLWEEKTAINNYTGSNYLEFTGNEPTNGPAQSPLEYTFQINKAGLYYLHLRCAKVTVQINGETRTDVANDCYFRVEGDYGAGPNAGNSHGDDAPLSLLRQDTKYFGGSNQSWKWENGQAGGNGNFDPGGHSNKRIAVYDFKAGETYKLVMSGRSQLFKVDRIVFRHTDTPESSAHDTSRPESEQGSGNGGGDETTVVYDALDDFSNIDSGVVPYYRDTARDALAINASIESYRNEFARATRNFNGESGIYDVRITALREVDGECSYRLTVGGSLIGTRQNSTTSTDYAPQVHVFSGVYIANGTSFSVASNSVSNNQIPEGDGFAFARGRWTQVEFVPAGQSAAPTVAITSPANGATQDAPADFNITADASDPDGTISQVEFFVNGGSIGTDSTAPYSINWNNVAAGDYTVTASATDNDGITTISSPITVQSVTPVTEGVLSGELKKWHKVTLTFDGPSSSETATPNPFMDYRLDVTFSGPSGQTYVVPGFYAADGNAANTGATSGNKWRVHFSPDEVGEWSYSARFVTGTRIAINGAAGTTTSFNGASDTFTVGASDKTGRDFRGKGRLQYVDGHYLRFADSGEYFLKQGPDAPENFLAYADFDGPFKTDGNYNTGTFDNEAESIKTWSAHSGDWNAGDPTWGQVDGVSGSYGRNMIGALNYLASEGLNAFSFLTFNIAGDDRNVFMYTNYNARERIDVSRVAQWEVVFEHATKLGLFMHFKTQETENDLLLDGGELEHQRKLYYRELIARFGHHLALNWNLGEEHNVWSELNDSDQTRVKSYAQYFYDTDPYGHHIVIHSYPNQKSEVYTPLLGNASRLTGASLQTSSANFSDVHGDVRTWVQNSASAGKPWAVACDEPGDAQRALRPDNDAGNSHEDGRKNALWGTLMAGGYGNEWYFGYGHAHSDLTCEDFRSRDNWWDYCRYALEFFDIANVPYWEMVNDNALTNADYCYYKAGAAYIVYDKSGGSANLDLPGHTGTFNVRWYNPRSGGSLQTGSVASITGGANNISLGTAPGSNSQDWVILVTAEASEPVQDAGIVNIDLTSNANAGPTGGSLAGVVGNAEGANRWNAVGDTNLYSFLVNKDGQTTELSFQLTGTMAATQNDVDNLGEFFINPISDIEANGNFFETYAWVTGVDSEQDTSSFTIGGLSNGDSANLYLYATWPWIDTGSEFRLSSDGGSTWTAWQQVDGTPSEADAPLTGGSSYTLFEDIAPHSDGTILGEWRSILGEAGRHRGMFNGLQIEVADGLPSGPTVPGGAFLEENGLVVFDVESLGEIPPSPWSLETSSSGYLGTGYFRGTDDLFHEPGEGVVSYPIYITNAGRYQLNWRSRILPAVSFTDSNDSFARLTDADGNPVAPVANGVVDEYEPWYKVYQNDALFRWMWDASNKDGDARSISWNLSADTLYYFEISVRSENHAVDRVALWDHSLYDFANKNTGKQANISALDALDLSERQEEASNNFSAYMANYPSLTGNDALAFADPDNDGASNVLEQWLAMNPTIDDRNLLPVESVSNGEFHYQFSYDPTVTGSTLIYETSTNLVDWTTQPIVPGWITENGGLNEVDIVFDLSEEPFEFHRLKVIVD